MAVDGAAAGRGWTADGSVSGEVAQEPVLSPKSGHVFERRLIEKYISHNGKDPVSGDELALEDLIAVKATKTVKPRAPTATSIPSLLSLFQNEWDAVVLETYSLKQQLEQARQELAHALYQHEAACRVIARLVKERDTARAGLAALQPHMGVPAPASAAAPAAAAHDGGSSSAEPMDEDAAGAASGALSQAVTENIEKTAATLSQGRRKRTIPETLATAEQVQAFKQTAANTGLHSASTPGLTALALHPDGVRVLTGGVDKQTIVYDRVKDVILHTLKGHTKRVTSVQFHPSENYIYTASQDKTVRLWHADSDTASYKSAHIFKAHKSDVTAIALHPSHDYLLSLSLDSTWALSDARDGQLICQTTHADVNKGYTAGRFHPDGKLLGAGTADSVVRIWDLQSQTQAAALPGHTGRITSVAFSENGYHLAVTSEDNTVKLWDLRKLANFKTLTLGDGETANVATFDASASYLAVGGSSVRVYVVKQWNELVNLTDHTGPVTDVAFGADAKFLASVSLDRSLRIFGN